MKQRINGSLLCLMLTVSVAGAAQEGSFDRSLSVSGPVDLDVKADSGSIRVRRGSSSTVHVHAIIKASNHGGFWGGSGSDDHNLRDRIEQLEHNPPVEQSGDTVRVGYVHHADLLRNISIEYEIETPDNTRLHARADSGKIEAEQIRGPIDAQADSGSISVHEIGSEVHARADSGTIEADDVRGSFFARVDSGQVKASGIEGSIDAQADSGTINLAQTKAAPISAHADSGTVRVRLASGSGYDLNASAESGTISHGNLSSETSSSNHHVEGKIRNGGPAVNLKVESGTITVD